MTRQYIVTNCAYGTGPYLRILQLALRVNDALEKKGHARFKIVVPLIYGAKQKKITKEEFGDFMKMHPDEVIYDKTLGTYLKSIFYGDESYNVTLKRWCKDVKAVSKRIQRHLRTTYGNNIRMELHRSPRLNYNTGAPAYFTSFASIAEIYENALGNKDIAIDDNLLEQALPLINEIESNYRFHFIAEPGTFSYQKNRSPHFNDEHPTPPIISPPVAKQETHKQGIFVTVTGIPGLERLYQEASSLGLRVYSNDLKAIPFGVKALPHIIGNPAILLQFARSGWSSVWHSQLTGTPLVVPAWDPHDDPEIYFNNICIEKLGLGIVYRGQSLKALLDETEKLKPNIIKYNQMLEKRFGTLDGITYCANNIADDFLS